jgi:hypothetical protein
MKIYKNAIIEANSLKEKGFNIYVIKKEKFK